MNEVRTAKEVSAARGLTTAAILCPIAGVFQLLGGTLIHVGLAALFFGGTYGINQRKRTGGYLTVTAATLVLIINSVQFLVAVPAVLSDPDRHSPILLFRTGFWVMFPTIILVLVGLGWSQLKGKDDSKGSVRGAI